MAITINKKDLDQIGLYIPAHNKLFIVKKTRQLEDKLAIDKLRKVLLGRGYLDFQHLVASNSSENEKKAYNPIFMSVKEAKDKSIEIEEVIVSDTDWRRTKDNSLNNKEGVHGQQPNGLFKRSN